MKWLIDNWSLLVVIICAIGVAFVWLRKFAKLPSDEQLLKVRQALLWIVIECERELGSNTGRAKLAKAYNMFIQQFPSLVPVIPYSMFCKLVDDALDEMRHLLETNLDIAAYVDGEEK